MEVMHNGPILNTRIYALMINGYIIDVLSVIDSYGSDYEYSEMVCGGGTHWADKDRELRPNPEDFNLWPIVKDQGVNMTIVRLNPDTMKRIPDRDFASSYTSLKG